MPKLPANYVKAPGFDNPLRATAAPKASFEHSLLLQLDEATWNALQAVCQAEGATPEAFALLALERRLREPEPGAGAPGPSAIAPSAPEPPQPSKRAQLLDQLYEQFVRRSWLQCVLTMRAILRDARA